MRRLPAAVVAGLLAAGLVGCTQAAPAPDPGRPTVPGPSATYVQGEESVPVRVPELRPGGTAAQNEQYFGVVIDQYFRDWRIGTSQQLVDALAAAGFERSAIEVTYEHTAIGLQADSIEVAVRFGDECLMASVRMDTYTIAILPVLGTGRCLIGATYPVG